MERRIRATVLEAAQGCVKRYPFFVLVFDAETGRRVTELEEEFAARPDAEAYAGKVGDGEVAVLKEAF